MARLLLMNEASLVGEFERSFIRRPEFELVRAGGGEEILRKARARGADLILAATRMPDMPGTELVGRLRLVRETASIPIILYGAPAEREEARAVAPDGFLPVPWTRSQLLGLVRPFCPAIERMAERARVSLKVLCGEGRGTFVAFTRDISTTGLFLKGHSPAPPGDTLRVRIQLPARPAPLDYDLFSHVVRQVHAVREAHALPGIGVRFLGLSVERKVPLARFVREHASP